MPQDYFYEQFQENKSFWIIFLRKKRSLQYQFKILRRLPLLSIPWHFFWKTVCVVSKLEDSWLRLKNPTILHLNWIPSLVIHCKYLRSTYTSQLDKKVEVELNVENFLEVIFSDRARCWQNQRTESIYNFNLEIHMMMLWETVMPTSELYMTWPARQVKILTE